MIMLSDAYDQELLAFLECCEDYTQSVWDTQDRWGRGPRHRQSNVEVVEHKLSKDFAAVCCLKINYVKTWKISVNS